MSRLLLTHVTVPDGIHGPAPRHTVVVEDGRITHVGPDTEAPQGVDGDRVVDLAGRTFMPGMWTCHFHATYHELGAKPNVPYGNDFPPAPRV